MWNLWTQFQLQASAHASSDWEVPPPLQMHRLQFGLYQEDCPLEAQLQPPGLVALHLSAMSVPLSPGTALPPPQVRAGAYQLRGLPARISLSGRLWAAQKGHRLLGQPGAQNRRDQVFRMWRAIRHQGTAEGTRRGSSEGAELCRVRERFPLSFAVDVPHGRTCWEVPLPLSDLWTGLSSPAELREPL